MEIFDLNTKVHLDLSEIDTAIEKANQLLALLEKAKETAGFQKPESELDVVIAIDGQAVARQTYKIK